MLIYIRGQQQRRKAMLNKINNSNNYKNISAESSITFNEWDDEKRTTWHSYLRGSIVMFVFFSKCKKIALEEPCSSYSSDELIASLNSEGIEQLKKLFISTKNMREKFEIDYHFED